MATKRSRSRRVVTTDPPPQSVAELSEEMQRHLHVLGVATLAEYRAWCRRHEFAPGVQKNRRQLDREENLARRTAADRRIVAARVVRRPDRVLLRLLDGESVELPALLEPVQVLLADTRRPAAQRAFARDVLRVVAERCPELIGDHLAPLLRLVEFAERVVRPPAEFRPRTRNAERRFAALARHLFAQWPVPAFLDSAWYDHRVAGARHRAWFLHLGSGQSIRTVEGLPFAMTKKMAHHFLLAPSRYTVLEALRWGQVHGLGGDAPLVEALRGTALVRGFEHHEFWESVLRFFIRNPLLDRAHVGPVLDYLFAQRFAEERVADERGRVRAVPPPQPNLTMRGRNPDALLRQVGTWHRRLGHGFAPQQNVTWGPSGILPYRSVEKDRSGEVVRTDTVRELCSTAQLVAEGREMHHCVATYWQSCRGGRCSIWSVEVQEGDGLRQKLLTIEVRNSSREIVQARGKRNERPGSRARSVMMSWARAVELRIADWV